MGAEYAFQDRTYRFYQNANGAGDAATVDGDVCVAASTTSYVFTNARPGSAITASAYVVVGVAVGVISKNNYGFLLVRGIHTNVKGVATTTAGYLQEASSTAASGHDNTTAQNKSFGVALTGLTGGRYTVQVDC